MSSLCGIICRLVYGRLALQERKFLFFLTSFFQALHGSRIFTGPPRIGSQYDTLWHTGDPIGFGCGSAAPGYLALEDASILAMDRMP